MTPLRMEREIVRPIEYILKDFAEVKTFSSFIGGQYARVLIQLKPKADIETFKIQVNEKFRQKWTEWKLKIKYPTWDNAWNDNRQKLSYAVIHSDGHNFSKEDLEKFLTKEHPHLSVDQFIPLKDQAIILPLSKSNLLPFKLELIDIKNQLAKQFQKLPSLSQLLNAKITNSNFLTETLYFFGDGKIIPANPNLWVQGQPAYKIVLSFKKTLRQLLYKNYENPIFLNDKITLYPINTRPQPTLKQLKWSLYSLLLFPLIPLIFRKIEILLLLLIMQFLLFTCIINFSQTLSIHHLWLFMSAIAWPFLWKMTPYKISFLWGYFFLFGCLLLYNHWVIPIYNLSLIATVLGSWTIVIGIAEHINKKTKSSPSRSFHRKTKYFWITLSALGLIAGFLWNKNKNNFFEPNKVSSSYQNNNHIRLGVTFRDGTDNYEFSQKLLTLLKQLRKLVEVKTISLDTRMPNGLAASISLNKKASLSGSSRIRNEVEKFMFNHPNQTFLIEGLGKELAQSSAIIYRGFHLVLKGFHYPELMKQALAIQNNLRENRRVSQTYLGHSIGPNVETSQENILLKTSSANKARIGLMLDKQMIQQMSLDLADFRINFFIPASSSYQWTSILQSPFFLNGKLVENPIQQSSIESYNPPQSIMKKNGIFELVIGFSFLGSKRQAETFLRQKQKEINLLLPFGLSLYQSDQQTHNIWLKLVGGCLILAGFAYIIDLNNFLTGGSNYLLFVLTFFIGHWLLVAIPSTQSIISSIPLLSYWVFSICQIHGAILFKAK